METGYTQSDHGSSSGHQTATSRRHGPESGRGRRPQVLEVHPPRKAVQERRARHHAVEPEVFPLVSAAHEFKTPLVAMLGYTDLLRSARLGPINDKQKQVLDEMQESAERLQKLIQDLLLLFQLKAARGAGGNKLALAVAEVNEHVGEIFNYWAPAAKLKSIAYEFHPAPGRLRVRVETLKLQHIISNLIENALKYTPTRGQVVVSVTPCFWERRKTQTEFLFNLERSASRRIENAVRIDVTDSGPGIPPEHREDIFWDFVQLPGASSRGTGLGLAIARRLTEAYGGAIWVESELGKGSKFSLLLDQTNRR